MPDAARDWDRCIVGVVSRRAAMVPVGPFLAMQGLHGKQLFC